jgi:hypothetical protein
MTIEAWLKEIARYAWAHGAIAELQQLRATPAERFGGIEKKREVIEQRVAELQKRLDATKA